ncbi:putative protein kinase RLK-Pelle-RLCK-VIIa-2 family [Medicago truncatula]|uniref:Protein kinase domain-containing protein n=1 Tax=Medicago truncatula TaxID=3880 RepID=A0A396IW90_MEDTR|nr:putative protein kinase RLK-Pelle-RLCK-VIIa-2 family [Medicago truncatula]
MKIALGTAKGLAFLHEADKLVIYRDFKTSNILLDSDYTAKLSDLGLAKDGPEGEETHVTTTCIMGTKGYAAPEYIMADSDVLLVKGLKNSTLVWRLIVLAFAMVCGVCICSICLKQISTGSRIGFLDINVIQMPCPGPNIEPWEIPYVHYPNH